MKMPEPIGYLSQYNLTMLEQGYPQTIVMLKGEKRNLPIYNKQALIDLLEAAAVECEQDYRVLEARRAHADSTTLGGANYAYFNEVMARLTSCAATIRKLKETL